MIARSAHVGQIVSTEEALNAEEEDQPPSTGNGNSLLPSTPLLVSPPPLSSPLSPSRPSPQTDDSTAPPLNRPKLLRAKRPANLIRISSRSDEFRLRYYPEASAAQWSDWHWQVRNRLRRFEQLAAILNLSADERSAIDRDRDSLPLGITPYYASLLDPKDALQGLRRTVVPVSSEFVSSPGEKRDPLGEEGDSRVPGLVHRYPDRVLFLVSAFCSVYCRYCTRSRVVGNFEEYRFNRRQWEQGIAYIEAHPQIRDVLISGGDPLDLSDDNLEWLVARIRAIKHVEFLRIGTKVPAVLPQRVTLQLTRMLKRYHPLWMSLHFTHPDELTPETVEACGRLADAGIPLGSQTVLLKGVNDTVEIMKRLFHYLLRARVRPYYLYQCDPMLGSAHFRTPIEKGLEIIRGLRGHTTGYAVPQYVIDAPGGGGKIPLLPEYYLGREGDDVLLRNFEGEIYRYPDPFQK
jgi:lysine 2,3-aminomutase